MPPERSLSATSIKIFKNNEKIFIKKESSANRKASNSDLFMKSVHNEARRNNVGIVMDGRVAEGREGSEVKWEKRLIMMR